MLCNARETANLGFGFGVGCIVSRAVLDFSALKLCSAMEHMLSLCCSKYLKIHKSHRYHKLKRASCVNLCTTVEDPVDLRAYPVVNLLWS